MTRIPGFLDEGAGRAPALADRPVPPIVDPPIAAAPIAAAPLGPLLFEPERPGPSGQDRVDPSWRPAAIRAGGAYAPQRSSLFWLASGLSLLGAAWIALSAWDFVADQFLRSPRLGWTTAALFGTALLVACKGVQVELASWRRLARVDALRASLSAPSADLPAARARARRWLADIAPRLPDPERAARAVASATTTAELRASLRAEALDTLDPIAAANARTAALQGGSLVAIVPSPALEGGIVAIRGLALIRQTARLYGLRPGPLVTLSLLRRVTLTAAGVAGVDLIAQSTTDLVLHRMPLLRHLTAAIPGTSVAAIRLYRLGLVAAKACSPVPGEDPDG